eukprot:7059086-Alexandrium_andersonii.AAC.1
MMRSRDTLTQPKSMCFGGRRLGGGSQRSARPAWCRCLRLLSSACASRPPKCHAWGAAGIEPVPS